MNSTKYPWPDAQVLRAIAKDVKRHKKGDYKGGWFQTKQIDTQGLPDDVVGAKKAYKEWNSSRVKLAKLKRRQKDYEAKHGRTNRAFDLKIGRLNDKVKFNRMKFDIAKQGAKEAGFKIDSRGSWKNRDEYEAKRAKEKAIIDAGDYKLEINGATKERAINYAKDRYEDQIENVIKRVEGYVKDAPLTIRVPEDVLSLVLESGRFKSQHESGDSKGWFAPDERLLSEQNAFGNDYIGTKDKTKSVIYGYMDATKNGFNDSAGHYGPIKVVLKDDVKNRTTVTYGDSLGPFERREATGSPTNKIGPECLDDGERWGYGGEAGNTDLRKQASYIEAQIQGGVSVSDIAQVTLPAHYMDGWAINELRSLGVDVKWDEAIKY